MWPTMVNSLKSSSCSSSGSIELIISSCSAISHIKLKAKGPLRTYGLFSNCIWALGHNLRDWGPYLWQALVAWSFKWKNLIGLSTFEDCARTLTFNIPLHLISDLSSKHFRSLSPEPSSGSGLTIAILSRHSRSLLFSSSLQQFESSCCSRFVPQWEALSFEKMINSEPAWRGWQKVRTCHQWRVVLLWSAMPLVQVRRILRWVLTFI